MQEICDKRELNIKDIVSGSRRRFVSKARRIVAYTLVKDHGIPLLEVASMLVFLSLLYLS